MVAYTARKNPLAMPTGAPAPAPAYDVSADAYKPGAMSAAPMTASPMAPSAGSPFSPPQGPPRNALLASALEGFQRGFDPAGFEKRETANKAAEGDKLKQTLALMQQQRALPEQQRGQWWQQNAPTISKIIGQDVSQVPVDVSKFTNEALDGQIAALSAQAGIGPVVPEPMSAYEQAQIKLREQELAKTGADKLTTEVGGNGNYWSFNTASGQMEDTGVKAPAAKINGEGGAQGVQSVHIDQTSGRATAVMRDGSTKDLGFQPVQTQIVDVGGVPTLASRIPGAQPQQIAPLADVAGNRAAVASAEVQGKAQGQAAFDLPGIEFRSRTAIASVDDLKSRNIGQRYGMQGKLYAIPGTEGADIQALVTQVASQAFLNAFDQLRGAGAITQTEGEAATAAITRLKDQNISVGEALKAMNELQGYYRRGIQVARDKAIKAPVLPGRPAGATGSTRTRVGVPPLLAKPQPAGVPDGVDPADWEFMTPEQKALFQ
jgi:hypothetical protein